MREYRLSEWRTMLLRAGMRTVSGSFLVKHRPIRSLTDTAEPADALEIRRMIDAMSDRERRRMNIDMVDGEMGIDHYLVLILALRD